MCQTAYVLLAKPNEAVDKDGNPFLDANDLKDLGEKGEGITTKNWKDYHTLYLKSPSSIYPKVFCLTLV